MKIYVGKIKRAKTFLIYLLTQTVDGATRRGQLTFNIFNVFFPCEFIINFDTKIFDTVDPLYSIVIYEEFKRDLFSVPMD